MTTLTSSTAGSARAAFVGRMAFAALVALRRLRRLRTRRSTARLQSLPETLRLDLGLTRTDLLTATMWGRSRL